MRYCWLAVACVFACGGSTYAASFSVRDYGAVGDRTTLDTASFQKAIDAAHETGGGTVTVPAGEYLCGGLVLRSHVTLQIESGAVVFASTRSEDYSQVGRGRLLTAEGAKHIAVTGTGTIHGQGTADLRRRPGIQEPMPEFRTGVIQFTGCTDVAIRGITILYSDAWTVHLKQCDTVFIDGITIRNNYFRTNSDGIDPNSCRNVHISNCHIVAGDDCIVLKTTEPDPCENVVVTNCTLESIATALKLGTESHGDFRDIHFSNIVVRNSRGGIGLFMKDGATMERVTFSNISIESADPEVVSYAADHVTPIYIDVEMRREDSPLGTVRDITFSDIQIRSVAGVLLQSAPERPIENLTIRNLSLRVFKPMDYANRTKVVGGRREVSNQRDIEYARQPSYVTVANVDGFTFENVRVDMSDDDFAAYPRAALSGHELANGTIANVSRKPSGSGSDMPVVRLENARRVLIRDGVGTEGDVYLRAWGAGTADVVVRESGLEGSILIGDDVPDGAVRVIRGEE